MEIVTMLTPSPQKVCTSPVCPKNKRKNDSDWASQDQKNVFGNLSPEIAKRRLIMENVHDEVGHVLDGGVDAVENIVSNFQLDHFPLTDFDGIEFPLLQGPEVPGPQVPEGAEVPGPELPGAEVPGPEVPGPELPDNEVRDTEFIGNENN